MFLTFSISYDRSFLLNFVNLVSCDGIKRDVDCQNDGYRSIQINRFNNTVSLNPTTFVSNQWFIFFKRIVGDKCVDEINYGCEKNRNSECVGTVHQKSFAFATS